MAAGDLSWEECVTQALVNGSPSGIMTMQSAWQVFFHRLTEINTDLEQFGAKLKESFTGPAGDAYQGHLKSMTDSISNTLNEHRPIIEMLGKTASVLSTAQAQMPVPSDMLDDIRSRTAEQQLKYDMGSQGAVSFAALVPPAIPFAIASGGFRDALAGSFLGGVSRELVGKAERALDWFTDDQKEEANRVLRQLDQQTSAAAVVTPDAAPVDYRDPRSGEDQTFRPPSGYPMKGGGEGMPSIGGGGSGNLGGGGLSPSSMSPFDSASGSIGSGSASGSVGDIGSIGGSGSGIGSGSGYDPSGDYASADDWAGTGLAGAGGGISGGAGGFGSSGLGGSGSLSSGSSGLGGGLGSGGGAAGIGGGAGGSLGGAAGLGAGIGAGASMLGKGVSPSMAGLGAGGAGRGLNGQRGAGSGRSGSVGGAGMMGGGAGAGHGGSDGPTRDTWLQEDEDVWGTGGGNSSNWSFGDA